MANESSTTFWELVGDSDWVLTEASRPGKSFVDAGGFYSVTLQLSGASCKPVGPQTLRRRGNLRPALACRQSADSAVQPGTGSSLRFGHS